MNVSGKTTVKKMLKSVHLNRTDALFQTQKINESKSTNFNKTNMVIILSKPQHLILVYVSFPIEHITQGLTSKTIFFKYIRTRTRHSKTTDQKQRKQTLIMKYEKTHEDNVKKKIHIFTS